MSLAVLSTETVNAECLALTLPLPRRGAMPIHLELSADTAPAVGEVATLILASETGDPETFTGTVRRVSPWAGRVRVVMVLGAGHLRDSLISRDHVGGPVPVTALLVAQGIADAAGESLSPLAIPALFLLTLPRWTRAGADAAGDGGTAIEALDTLISRLAIVSGQPEMTWRMIDTGEIWIGVDVFEEGGDTGNVFDDDGDDGAIHCAPPAATLRPGTTINGRMAERVTYRIEGGALRAEVLYTVPGDLSANETPDVYREAHSGVVQAQHSDGTIDIALDDPRLAGNGMCRVPFRIGIPGSTVTLPGGSIVSVAFADADPSQPFAYSIDQDAAAVHAFSLVGDDVDCGTITAISTAPGSAVLFVYTTPGGIVSPPLNFATLSGIITGPGHKYAKGVKDS